MGIRAEGENFVYLIHHSSKHKRTIISIFFFTFFFYSGNENVYVYFGNSGPHVNCIQTAHIMLVGKYLASLFDMSNSNRPKTDSFRIKKFRRGYAGIFLSWTTSLGPNIAKFKQWNDLKILRHFFFARFWSKIHIFV